MTRRRAEVLAWSLWLLAIVVAVGSELAKGVLGAGSGIAVGHDVIGLPFVMFATVGAVVASRRPENRIGWLYLAIGVIAAVASLGEAIQDVQFPAHGPGRPAVMLIYAVTNGAWFPALALLATLAILWFPDGRTPTPRWHWVEVGVMVAGVALLLGFQLVPGPLNGPGSHDNPIGIPGAEDVLGLVQAVAGVCLLVLIGASIAGFAARFRRSRGVERLQLRWFLVGALVFGIGLGFELLLSPSDEVLMSAAVTAIPLTAGIAIMRYHLYDLDRLISRAVAYLAVSAVLVAVYAAIVVGIGTLTGRAESPVVIAGATLAVAALVRPMVRRMKATIDRRFYRRRYDAQMALETFAAGLRDEVALEQVRAHLLRTVRETMQPARATLWLRGGER